MSLIIVESPTKARTFNRILKIKASEEGKGKKVDGPKPVKKGEKKAKKIEAESPYYVFATLGHIRDLPTNKMSIDFTKEFEPEYDIMASKQKVVSKLKELAKEHDEIIFATDQDREGESISYHAAYLLGYMNEKWPDISMKPQDKLKKTVKRIVFHEITGHALEEALKNPTEIRLDLVKAQQARRILDRIVGYQLSPLLWKKMNKNWLSAGRVQTVALRFVVEREKEIRAFKIEPYYTVTGHFAGNHNLDATLVAKSKEPYYKKTKVNVFAGTYEYSQTTITKENLDALLSDLKKDTYKVSDIKVTEAKRYPPPPFTTSLLQQEAINRYGFSSKLVMRLAQGLYERGYITYHRTDSFNLSTSFVFRAKDFIEATYGKDYALEKPRGYRTKSANAQEAHEAIRPTNLERVPAKIKAERGLTKNHKLLYELIFNRALATQMKEASVDVSTITIMGEKGYTFESESQKVVFDGFLKVLSPSFAEKHKVSVANKVGDSLTLDGVDPEEKATLPPPRYSEAALIKILEEHGIGRPSTYSSIISLIQDKGYVEKQGRYLVPNPLGEAISDYLSSAFPTIFAIDFTASFEEQLDQIADGKVKLLEVLHQFFTPFESELKKREGDTTTIEVKEEVTEPCPQCGSPLQVRYSKFGKFLACTTYPKCKFTKSILKKVDNKICPRDGGEIVVRYTKTKRKFFGCDNYPKCDYTEFVWKNLVSREEKKDEKKEVEEDKDKKYINS